MYSPSHVGLCVTLMSLAAKKETRLSFRLVLRTTLRRLEEWFMWTALYVEVS